VSGSTKINGNAAITGSLSVTGGITGSLQGTATTASYALTASSAQNASDILIYVKNSSGAQIDKGKVVRIAGAVGDNALIATASYINDDNSANTLGITNQNIANDAFGYVITEGTLIGINTNAFIAGQLIYLGDTGSIIGTAPVAPLHAVRLGQVLRSQLNNGSIYVRIDNGYEIGELHDVKDTTTTGSYGDLLVKSGSIWINSKQLTGSYGLTGSLTVSGSATTIGTTVLSGSLNVSGSITSTSTITAQTLVVQTITSSVDFVTGSTRFGSLLANTHAFTGSVGMTGSLTLNNIAIPTSASLASTYLQLAGGTLTGALGGTSATLSSFLTVSGITTLNAYANLNRSSNTGDNTIHYQTANSDKFYMGLASASDNWRLYSVSSGNNAFTINATTDAATFSNSVTTGGSLDVTGTGNVITMRKASNVPAIAWVGATYTALIEGGDYLNFYTGGVGSRLYITSGGNVGINTTTPGTKLEIAGAAIADPLMLRLSNTAGLTYYWDMWRDNTTGYLNFGSALGGSKSTYVSISTTGVVQPGANGTQDLGTSSLRWATVYTSDLSLSNGIGDYTIVEGEDDLFLYNNKSNKVYKFMLAEVDPANATPKKST
jgi:hypothetical protein